MKSQEKQADRLLKGKNLQAVAAASGTDWTKRKWLRSLGVLAIVATTAICSK